MRFSFRPALAVLVLALAGGCYSTPSYTTGGRPGRAPRIQPVRHWNELQELIRSSRQPLAVIFQLPTCPHCKALKKKLPALASEYPGITFATVDGGRTPYPPYKHGVKGYPTTVIFSNGREIDRFGGNRLMFSLRKRFDRVAASYR
ncbi:MAG: thioredoxin family protein [Lentisphaerae bacterium]|jgi:thioredoxin-like negative regulator of GroEL|nr:thioredoxin family protein [Lentisphaerota bacterium]MBT4815397.1 thioredoxin family protein [Lentisphaerota bacterium]MBT5611269.1 thioredoxin family protein [Lentisphaerota bacterium]MBT7058414.1 thioredoxin family protein [Lentisphaerota bacterium]MBT7846849.1 thioredoxin family protein [Lentisphaerota bacterium]